MSTILVTIAGPEDRVDLSVPAETPIAALMPTFRAAVGVDDAQNGSGWAIGPVGQQSLPDKSTLAECGVVDGSVLVMRPLESEEAPPPPPPPSIPAEEFRKDFDKRDLQRRAGFPLQRGAAALPEWPNVLDRMTAAGGAFFSSGDSSTKTGPPADEEGAVARPSDLAVARPPSRAERARTSWRDTSYLRRLDAMIAEPRLRRCATIAVVSPKGGVGKTTMTALLGALLVHVRHERIVAVDTNPDFGSLGRALTPDHRVFVDDLLDVLDHPDLTVTELERKLGRGFDGLMVLPAPTDPTRMAALDKEAYEKVFDRLKTMVGALVLDCGTGLQEPAAQAAIEAADQLVLVSDSEPSTASLVAEAAQLLKRSGAPMFLVVNKRPRKGARLDLERFSRAVPNARALLSLEADPVSASRLAAGDFSWNDAPSAWQQTVRELAALMVADWPDLGLAS